MAESTAINDVDQGLNKAEASSPVTDGVAKSVATVDKKKGEKVDLELVLQHFKKSVIENEDVDSIYFVKAYREINRLFELLGSIFQFVASDVDSKLTIMEERLGSADGSHYRTVKSMIEYEKEKEMSATTDPPSGSRTFLRLHRALEFVTEFLNKLGTAGEIEKLSSHAQDAYKKTLACHHPWLIQKAVNLAMYALPTPHGLLEKTCIQSYESAKELLPQIVAVTNDVYKRTQDLYEKHNILKLP